MTQDKNVERTSKHKEGNNRTKTERKPEKKKTKMENT